MAFQLDATAIAHVSMNPAVRDAAAVGTGLIELWPLTDAKQMDNDTKYGENLQVRMTRMAARVMTGDDVTVPDAEFVYEGADEIPGRPQRIVDALLAANDAYDEMGDYSETGDTRLIMRGAGQLGVDWDDDTVPPSPKRWRQSNRPSVPPVVPPPVPPRLRMLRPVPMSKPSRSDSPR